MEISARALVRGRSLYHIMQDLSIGNLYKNFEGKNPLKLCVQTPGDCYFSIHAES